MAGSKLRSDAPRLSSLVARRRGSGGAGGAECVQNGTRLILHAIIILKHHLLKKASQRLMAAIFIDILRNRSHSTEGSIIYDFE